MMMNRRNNNVPASWNPFREMDRWERSFFGMPVGFFGDNFAEFKTDIKDEGDAYLLEADLPGFAKEDITLDLNDHFLTVKAQRHFDRESKDEEGKYICCERSYGSYSRSFDVSGIDIDAIKAKYDNGVLTLHMPKKTPELPHSRRLEIE